MRRRRGIFLQKAMAVLLSALLCVGLIVGAEPMNTWAEEETPTQTAYLIVEFDGSTEVPTVDMDVHLEDDNKKVYSPSSSSKAGSVTYKVEGLIPNEQYYWIIDGTTIPFKRDSSEYTVVRTLYAVKYMDSGKVWYTQYVAYGGKAQQPPSNPTKEGYTFVGWQASNGTEFSFNTSIIKESTRIYAAWKRIISNDALGSRLEEMLGSLSITDNTKTNEAIEEDVKKNITSGIDQTFDIKSTVTVKITGRENATNEKEGLIKLEVSVRDGEYSANREKSISIPRQGEDWILYSSGYLSINSQKGMNDWVQNGRRGTNNLSDVKTIYISYYDVEKIPANAFSDCKKLEYVSIPGTVTNIGNGAFYNCSSLRTVEMRGEEPPEFEGDSFFDGCLFVTDSSNGGSIVVPSGSGKKYQDAVGEKFAQFVKEMAPPKSEVTEAALSEKLQEILNELPVSNSTTMDAAMRDVKKALDDYFLNTSTIQAGYYALTRANYENDGLIVLEMTAFCDRYSVTKQVTKSVPKLTLELEEAWLLDEDGNLVISGQKGMDGWVNNGRTEEKLPAVKNVLIWGEVTEIPDNAFSNCSNLEYASVSKTVTSIGNSAFAGCNSLEKVVMQGTTPPTSIGNSAFDGCKFVTDPDSTEGIVVPPGSEDAYKSAGEIFKKYIKAENPVITEQTLNSKLQEILGKLSVSNDTTAETVNKAVKGAIDGFFNISSTVTIGKFEITKATIEKEGSLKLAITAGYGESSAQADVVITIPKITIPDRGWMLDEAGNLVIGSQAGMDDWTLNGRAEGKYPAVKRVLIRGDVTSIPDSAFSGCGDLESIDIPDTVTSIGSLAFKNAFSLSEITLPPNLQSIGNSAFSDCSSLEKVVMQGTTPPSIGTSVFDPCKFVTDSIKGIVVPSGSGDAYRAAWGDPLGKSILEKHTHDFGSEWKSDGTNHWNECACGAKGNVASHTWNDGVVVMPPTAAEEGIMGYVCSVCQATRTELIPATGGNPSVSGGDNSSVSGNGNPGSNPTVSGNDNPNGGGSGDGTSVPGNGGSGDGGSIPGNGGSGDGGSVPGNGGSGDGGSVPGNGGSGGGTSDPGSSNSGDGSLVYSGSMQQLDNSNELALFWSAFNANAPKDTEPKTADGVPLELYATVAMIAGFFYLLLLFLDKYDITEMERRESLARLVRWAKCGGWPRRLPVKAVLLLMRTYYRIVDGQGSKRRKI